MAVNEDENTAIKNENITNNDIEITIENIEQATKTNQTIKVEGVIIQNLGTITDISNSSISDNLVSLEIYETTSYKPIYNLVGGIINNVGTINNIDNVNFDNNIISSSINNTSNTASIYGGIINNSGTINSINNTTFSNNTVDLTNNTSHAFIHGGLIRNSGDINYFYSDFINNKINNKQKEGASQTFGALIENTGHIGELSGKFSNNIVDSYGGKTSYQYNRGLIYNTGTIDKISGVFDNNEAILQTEYSSWHSMYGSLISTTGGGNRIGSIDATLSNNKMTVNNMGAINTTGLICLISSSVDQISLNAYNNVSIAEGVGYNVTQGAILYLNASSDIESALGEYKNNKAYVLQVDEPTYQAEYIRASGSVIKSNPNINFLSGQFKNNYTEVISYNSASTDVWGGVLHNTSSIKLLDNSLFEGNKNYLSAQNGKVTLYGGAIRADGQIGKIRNSSFIDNTSEIVSESEDIIAQGGAIYTTKDLTIESDTGESVFKGNKIVVNGEEDDNAIYLDNSSGTITFDLKNGGSVLMYDNIRGTVKDVAVNEEEGNPVLDEEGNSITRTEHYNVNIQGDNINKTTFHMYNQIYDADVTIGNTTVNMVNNQIQTNSFNKLTLCADTNLVADVDLSANNGNGTMDRLVANSYDVSNNKLNVVGFNLLSDMQKDKNQIEILFADDGLKNNVEYSTGELPHKFQTTFYTPIYKYKAAYENRDNAGYFVFARGGKADSNGAFNPTILATPVAAETGATATMCQTMGHAFQNVDNFMNLPTMERVAKMNANKYALNSGAATDVGTFSPLFSQNEGNSVWVKPYASFENIPLKNGPKVTNNTYGTLVGYDTDLKELKHGWARVWTGYIGYNGASQRHSGIDTTLNGGLIGGTLSLYKKNFFNATTISTGAIVGENNNMYGHENFSMLMAGVGNKTGYNLEFKEGRFIIQPNLLVSYTFVNTFDYTNAAGVKIESDPLHAIQVAPGVRFIGNFKNGWQPYVGVSMVWNLMGKSHSRANGVDLPEMSIKPYVQYGVGIQKSMKDHFMVYGQAMIQNGGRNGISLTGGFRWALGHDCRYDKVHKENKNIKVGKDKAPNSFANVVKDSLNIDSKVQDKAITTVKTINASEKPVANATPTVEKVAPAAANTTVSVGKTTSAVANTTPAISTMAKTSTNAKVVPTVANTTSTASQQPARRMVINTDESTITVHRAIIKGL